MTQSRHRRPGCHQQPALLPTLIPGQGNLASGGWQEPQGDPSWLGSSNPGHSVPPLLETVMSTGYAASLPGLHPQALLCLHRLHGTGLSSEVTPFSLVLAQGNSGAGVLREEVEQSPHQARDRAGDHGQSQLNPVPGRALRLPCLHSAPPPEDRWTRLPHQDSSGL